MHLTSSSAATVIRAMSLGNGNFDESWQREVSLDEDVLAVEGAVEGRQTSALALRVADCQRGNRAGSTG